VTTGPRGSLVAISSLSIDPAIRRSLFAYLVGHENDFQAATIETEGQPVVDEAIRRAKATNRLGPFQGLFHDRVLSALSVAAETHGLPSIPVSTIEVQATASSHGDFFAVHSDCDGSKTRAWTFVYFASPEPLRFSGGELRIYEPSGDSDRSPLPRTVRPSEDTLVLFPSPYLHQVLPLRARSRSFADSRFTVNGWAHVEAADVAPALVAGACSL
jgi:Rps23 Pro-64 3,4-dihydroxylase Tpa1-like proline 4-hydroxylase